MFPHIMSSPVVTRTFNLVNIGADESEAFSFDYRLNEIK